MRKLIYGFAVSLDGFIEGPEGSGDWMVPSSELHQHYNDFERDHIDTHLYGRRMWELMSGFWPSADDPSQAKEVREYARIWVGMEKVVFSRTLRSVEGARLATQPIEEEVRSLRERPGNDISIGGAELASEFFRLGLIDEVHMYIHPILLGSGKPMFQGFEEPQRLEPLEVTEIGEVTLLRFAVGAPAGGA